MATHPRRSAAEPAAEAAERVKGSAQQIWLAGLGAFAQAQQQGGKVFEALVEDGLQLQRKTQAAAQAQVAEATDRLSALTSGLTGQAGHQWDRLEGLFEQRVAKALQRLDIAQRSELDALRERIETLEAALAPSPKPTAKPAPKPAPKPAAKPATRRPAKRAAGPTGATRAEPPPSAGPAPQPSRRRSNGR